MKITLSILLLSPITIFAADFSGHWVGTGTMYQKPILVGNPTQSPCSKIEVWIEQTPQTITNRRYHATCGNIDSDWGPDVMQIQNGKVIDQGEEIGTYDGNKLITITEDGGVSYAFNLQVNGQGPTRTLHSYYGTRNGVGSAVIEANTLSLVP